METIKNTKKRYISFSEVNTFYERGQETYFQSYILGIRTPTTLPMMFGTIIHKMLAESEFDFEKDLIEKKFTADFIRIAKKINMSVPRCGKSELGLFVDLPEFCLYAGIDGVNEEGDLVEYKTGGSLWTKQQVEEHEQITHYLLSWYHKYNELLPFKLISISSKNGKFIEHRTHRTKEQLENYYKKLLKFKEDLILLNWWNSKCSFSNRIDIK